MSTIERMEELQQASLHCPECAAPNLPQRKFCAKCGTSLWETCLECGTISAAGEIYCGGCGTNLVEVAAARVKRLENDFRDIARMRSECRFNEAIAMLAAISKNEHPSLAEYASRAKQLVLQLAAERDRRRLQVEEDYQRALSCFEACDFDGAAKILETAPSSLRTDAVSKLDARIAARRQEIALREEEVREAVRAKRLDDLPSRIERLLALKPDHGFGKRLAEEVQKRLIDEAKKRLATQRYDEALRLLEQVSLEAYTPENQKLHHRIAELAWLTWDLRNAPVVDDTLIAEAERLRKLAPSDARTARLCELLRRRVKAVEGRPLREPLAWARPPQQTPLGIPVDWVHGFRRLTCVETMDRTDLERSSGRFAVACGLALAGIEQAAFQINLLSADQRGLWSQVTRLVQSRKTRHAWGIDVGANALKAVKLVWDESRQQANIEAATLIEHAKPLGYAANDAEKKKLATETVQAFLDRQPLKNERVCVGLPGRMTLSRQVDFFPMDSAKIAKAMEFEARLQFPFPLEQLAWDFQICRESLPGPDGPSAPPAEESWKVLLIAARDSTTRQFLDTFQRLGMRIDLLQTDFVALHNFLDFEYSPLLDHAGNGQLPSATAAIDIGGEVTNIVVSSPQSLWFHSCGVAGHSFTRALVKEFKLTVARAEQLKRLPHSAERLSDFYEVLSPVCGDLLKEVQHCLAAYAQARPDRPIQSVLGVGGGAMLHGLFRYLRCGR